MRLHGIRNFAIIGLLILVAWRAEADCTTNPMEERDRRAEDAQEDGRAIAELVEHVRTPTSDTSRSRCGRPLC